MLKPNQPLWLPEGSVRAIIALSLVFALIYLMVTKAEVPEWITPVITALIGFYFAGRENRAERIHTEKLAK